MEWSEKDIEDEIVKNPDLVDCDGFIGRQVKTSEGIIDLVGMRYDHKGGGNHQLVIVEIKKGYITPEAVAQLQRYVTAMESGREAAIGDNKIEDLVPTVQGCLIGTQATSEALYLAASCGFEIFTYSAKLWVQSAPYYRPGWFLNRNKEATASDKEVFGSLIATHAKMMINGDITPPPGRSETKQTEEAAD